MTVLMALSLRQGSYGSRQWDTVADVMVVVSASLAVPSGDYLVVLFFFSLFFLLLSLSLSLSLSLIP